MNCKNCGELLEEGAVVCPACGASQEEPETAEVLTEETNLEETAVEEAAEETVCEEAVEETVVEEAVEETVVEEAVEETAVEEAVEETACEEASEETACEEGLEAAPEEEPQKAPKRKRWIRVTAIVCCVCLALALAAGIWWGVNGSLLPRENNVQYRDSYTVEADKLTKALDKVVATVGSAELTNQQLQILYWDEVYRFLDQYSSYLTYFGLDISVPLSEQYVSEGGLSYQQYFLESALSNWHSYQSLVKIAGDEGYTMSESARLQLDKMPESLASTAAYYGFDSVDAMIQADMGPGADEDSYMEYLELYFLAMDYFDSVFASFSPDRETLEAYFDANSEAITTNYGVTKDSGKLVDVRHILVLPQGGTTDEQGQTTYSEEEWETCRKAAEAILKEWQEGTADEESFAQLANERSEDPGSNTNGGLYTFIYEGQMVEPFEDWCFDESRQPGDTGLVQTSYGYHVMYYVEGDEGWLRYSEYSYISDECNRILQETVENTPMEVNYKAIRLGEMDLA